MSRTGDQMLAATVAAFIAVTSLTSTGKPAPDHTPMAPRPAGLAGVGLPDTGPGTRRVSPLTLVITTPAPPTQRELHEVHRLAAWLTLHHGRARLQLLSPTAATPLSATNKFVTATRPATQRNVVRKAAATAGQHLFVTLGIGDRPASAAAWLHLTFRDGAPLPRSVQLHAGQPLVVTVDPRRDGLLAATVARIVISLADLNPNPSRSPR